MEHTAAPGQAYLLLRCRDGLVLLGLELQEPALYLRVRPQPVSTRAPQGVPSDRVFLAASTMKKPIQLIMSVLSANPGGVIDTEAESLYFIIGMDSGRIRIVG
jgi:hypothetical protein